MIVGFLQCRTPCFRGFTFKSCTGRIEELFTRRYNNRCLQFDRARHPLRGTEGISLASPRRSVFRVTCRHYWNGPNSCQSLSTTCMGLRVMTSCRQYWNGPGAGRSVSSRIYLQVIGTVSSQSAPSVLLFTDSQRYLFNCGESIHRLSCDLDISMDPGRIFLTGNQWQHIGGLSYIQYQPQALEPNAGIEVHGPAGTEDFVHSLYTFSKRHLVTKPSITCFDHHPSSLPLYKDDNVSIQTVILEDSKPAQGLPEDSLCFICKLADPPGKFLAERAQELGIPVGHMRKELLSGNPVVLPDGRTVKPDEVVVPPKPGQIFAVIDCSTAEKLQLLTNHKYFQDHIDCKQLDLMIHMTPMSLFQTNTYQSWVREFGPRTQHILLNTDTPACQRQLQLNNRLQRRLHSIQPTIFSAPHMEHPLHTQWLDLPDNCVSGQSRMLYNFRPVNNEGLFWDGIPSKPDIFWKSNSDLEESGSNYNEQQMVAPDSEQSARHKEDGFSVTFLGTGASKMSKLRNTSSMLVQIGVDSSILFDCGDGTFCQLKHQYGKHTGNVLASLKSIFISHKHIDHHMGLVNLLFHRQKAALKRKNYEPLVVVGPERLLKWLEYYNSRRNELHYRFISFTEVKSGQCKNQLKDLVSSLGLCKLSVVPVVHCDDSHGIVIAHASGWKLVYSGDCSPSGYLVREGADATLLIHEATFLPDYGEKEAKLTGHSTTDGAIEVSKRMRARYTILTHFSQRYNLKRIVKCRFPPGVSVAFDHMTVTSQDLPSLDRVLPNLRRALYGNKPQSSIKKQRWTNDRSPSHFEVQTRGAILSKSIGKSIIGR